MIIEKCICETSHPWHDQILILHVEQPQNKFTSICNENLFQKVPPYFMGDIMPLLHWEITWEYILPQYLQGSANQDLLTY